MPRVILAARSSPFRIASNSSSFASRASIRSRLRKMRSISASLIVRIIPRREALTSTLYAFAGSVLTASFWNTQVRDNFNIVAGLGAAWTSYTPTLSQGVTTNIAKTVNVSTYVRIGTLVIWSWNISITGAGTAGSAFAMTLPVNPTSTSSRVIGSGAIYDTSTSTPYQAGPYVVSNTIQFVGDWSGTGSWGVTPNLAVASGDATHGTVMYEVAPMA